MCGPVQALDRNLSGYPGDYAAFNTKIFDTDLSIVVEYLLIVK
jgi:hypothetical protein